MSLACPASSGLSLPSMMQSIFRAKFPSEIRLQNSLLSPRFHLQSKRYFIKPSAPRLSQSLNKPTAQKESSSNASSKPRSTEPKKFQKPKTQTEKPRLHKKPEPWQIQKEALKNKFKDGWSPSKKLSPDAIDGIRNLHAASPEQFSTPVLAEQFKVSPEAIRRILKSKWRPSEPEMEDRRRRWEKRHDRIWSQMAELGLRPKTKRSDPLSDANVLYDDPDKKQ